ncbi:hypothetical protein BKH41_01920 [Helicobacter sp. 12S02232-10]|nr:hypothetical protein BKH41_01920 [Helicobacter sp. 12S02232-10]
MSKARKHLQVTMLFESVSNANTIFKMERKIGDWLILIAGFFFITTLIELILIISLFPLKEKVPYLVTFATSTQNFAIVQKADSKITANVALIRQLLGAYILNRESINRIDDEMRFDIVREQSTPEVWQIFEKIVAKQDSIYTNNNLKRNVQIINISTIKKGYANADVNITLYANGLLQSEKRYRIVIAYEFKPIEIDFQSMPKNPTGFMVTGYAITEIATIKELDPKNQVKDPDKTPSRIHYKNLKKGIGSDGLNNEENINDAYQYNLQDKDKTSQESETKSDTKSEALTPDEIEELEMELERLRKAKELNKLKESENSKERPHNENTEQENDKKENSDSKEKLMSTISPLKDNKETKKETKQEQQDLISPFAGENK